MSDDKDGGEKTAPLLGTIKLTVSPEDMCIIVDEWMQVQFEQQMCVVEVKQANSGQFEIKCEAKQTFVEMEV